MSTKDSSGINDNVGDVDANKEVLDNKVYQDMLSKEKKLRDRLKTQETDMATLRSTLAERDAKDLEEEEKRLKENDQWKELAQKKEIEAKEATARATQLAEDFIDVQKLSAIQSKLPGKLKKSEYMRHLPTDKIIVEEDGTLNVESIEMAANDFLETFGSDLLNLKNGGGLPNDAARGGAKKLTREQWLKLPHDEKMNRLDEAMGQN